GEGRHGAVAQLGERLVRNEEVRGSIPLGSTSLRSLRELRLGGPHRSEGCRGVACRAKTGCLTIQTSGIHPAASASMSDAGAHLPTQLQSLASQCAKKFFSQMP